MTPLPQEVTQLLAGWRGGDPTALEKLMTVVYDELRRLAGRYIKRERPDHTLQATALVNEAYLRLAGQRQTRWQNRHHFYAVAAQVMRHLLVDHGRARRQARRGGGAPRVMLDEAAGASGGQAVELLALNAALNKLAALDPRKSRIVELRYFGGMSVEEAAEVLGVSAITVKREWLKARAWLYREINREEGDDA